MGQKPVTQIPRKRQLNVVYFVDSSRTRSFRLPLRRLNFLLLVFFGIFAWSIASVAVIGIMVQDRMQISRQLQESLAVIFDYETRFERVYEKAYPSDGRLVAPLADKDLDRDPDEPPALVSVNNAVAAASTAEDNAIELEEDMGEDGGESADHVDDTPAAEDRISVEDPEIEEIENTLEIRFKIKNELSPSRVEGFIWAVADFRDQNGSISYIGSPSSIDVGGEGTVKQKQRAHRFSIRHYKRKQFSFPFPKDRQGTITAIHIGVQYQNGKESLFDVPVDIPVGTKVEAAPDSEKKSG